MSSTISLFMGFALAVLMAMFDLIESSDQILLISMS